MRTDEYSPHDVAMDCLASGDDEPTRRFAESALTSQCLANMEESGPLWERPSTDYDTPVGAMPALVRMTAPRKAPTPTEGMRRVFEAENDRSGAHLAGALLVLATALAVAVMIVLYPAG